MKSIALSAAILATALIGCKLDSSSSDENKMFPNDGKPRFVIAVNQLVQYPRAEKLEQEISTFDGRTLWVNVNPFVHSKYIESITRQPIPDKPGFYSLTIKLNERGVRLWMHMAVTMKHHNMCFVIDGLSYRVFKPEMVDEKTALVNVHGPFDDYTSKALVHYGQINYKIFNPEDMF